MVRAEHGVPRCARAATLWLVALAIVASTAAGQEPEDQALVLQTRIEEQRALGEYAEAAGLAAELLALREADPTMTSFDIDDARRQVEILEHAAGLPEDARRELARADSLSLALWDLSAEGRYSEAAVLAEERVAVRRAIVGDAHYEVTLDLDELATLLQYSGDLDAPEPLFREAMEIRRGLLGDRHPDVGASMNNLAMLLQARGELAGAEPLLRAALDIMAEAYGDDDLMVAALTNNLGMLLYYQGDLDGAEPLYRESLAVRRTTLGGNSQDVATSLNNLAVLFHARGDYAQAEPFLRESTAIWRNLLGDDHPHVAFSLSNLAALLDAQGEYVKAEALHREALTIYRRTLGDEHPDVGREIGNLAHTLENLGDHDGAEPLFREALEIRTKVLGAEHTETAMNACNLAHLLQTQGEYEEAEPLYTEAVAVCRRIHGEEHLDLAVALSNLASLHEVRGDFEAAEPLYREALEIRRKLLGDANAGVAHSLSSLGHLAFAKGDPAAAEPLLEDALEAYDAARLRAGEGLTRATAGLRLRPPATALAAARLALGKTDEAWPVAERALARALADLLMATEERSLDALEAAREDSLKERLGTLERELAAYRAAAASDPAGDAGTMAERTRVELLAAEADWSLFREEIGRKYPVTEGQAYPLERVQASLPDGTALLGWIDAEIGPDREDVWAYVVRSDGPVVWAPCGPSTGSGGGSDRDKMQRLRGQLTDPTSSSIGLKRDARAAWARRVGPVADALDGVGELVVLPSGPALGIPLEAFRDDEGILLGERFAVSYAPSATIYGWLEERATSLSARAGRGRALLLGDPPFTPAHLEAMEREGGSKTGGGDGGTGTGGAAAPDAEGTGRGVGVEIATLERLPGSRAEVAMLEDLTSESTVLLGPDASEQALVRLAATGEIARFGTVHLATHALVDDERPERSALVLSQVDLPDPLESAIAGTRIYDGLLTAQEIVREWELGADLVTLSACETGLGKRLVGEGYIGFAHAFLQAGARSLIVSLWKVEDRATSLLMRRFYEDWYGAYEGERAGHAGSPMTKAEALRERAPLLLGRVRADRRTRVAVGRHPGDPRRRCVFLEQHPSRVRLFDPTGRARVGDALVRS